MMNTNKTFLALSVMATCFFTGVSSNANATLDFAQAPLFASVPIDPNIMFTLDDSGSMHWEIMPDDVTRWSHMYPRPESLYGSGSYDARIPWFGDTLGWNLRLRSAHVDGSARENSLAYNPQRQYRPWINADGTEFPAADPAAALHNPTLPDRGSVNLTAQQSHDRWWDSGNTDATRNFWPITFYVYTGGGVTNAGSYVKYQIRGTQGYMASPANAAMTPVSSFSWPNGQTRSVAQEAQNFANWYTYHRSRILSARAGIGRSFTELPDEARVGFGAINRGESNIDGVTTDTIVDGVRSFAGGGRQAFYDRLYTYPIPRSGTPLRRAAASVGEYFSRTDDRGPWSSTPGSAGGDDLSCRQSYHILMTDGFWNGPDPSVGNADGEGATSHSSPGGTQTGGYTPTPPFSDNRENTLADVAMHYWKNDLRPLLDNQVPSSQINPAFWQHVTSFGVGLGVQGSIDPDDAFAAIESETVIDWGNPVTSNTAKIDDLLHFGLNGRGGFFSAADPDTFAEELGAVLRDIVARASATSGLSASSTRLDLGAIVYSAEFDASDWSGDLLAIDAGTGNELRSAADELVAKGWSNRNILTYSPANNGGVAFLPTGDVRNRVMANAAPGWIDTELFNYIRGDFNAGAGQFRERDSMIGTIVNSPPVFSGAGNEGWGRVYPDYLDYIDGNKRDPRNDCGEPTCPGSRRDTVFVGSNSGALHAFDAKTLEERFAYIPAAVHGDIHRLADPSTNHRFFVDGQVALSDVRWGANDWRTVMVSNMGAGGRGVFAIDVTQPQSAGAGQVLWEFNHENDPDMGYGFGRPAISRLSDGTWVAIFGNGYNSASERAYLYVLNIKTGNVMAKIPAGAAGDNGLSGVAAVRDADTRSFASRVYAGDLKGNMWRFDLDDLSATTPALGGQPLFTDPAGRAIVSSPDVALHSVNGYVVFFGTGKLIENSDRLSVSGTDYFYAIRDKESPVPGIATLGSISVSAGPGDGVRIFESGAPGSDGWYVPLGLSATGERVLSSPQVFAGRIIFNSFEPSNDPCIPGGTTRTQVLNAFTGGGALTIDPDGNPCVGCGGIEVDTGAAVAPVIGIVSPIGGPPDEIGDPGYVPPPCDPDDPDCDEGEDPSDPVDGPATGSRDDWCRQYGILGMGGGNFIPLGTVCEGRQVWREVR